MRTEEEIYEVSRDYQDMFLFFFELIGLNNYGYYEQSDTFADKSTNTVIDNDTFTVRPYYWGDDENIISLPNFVYKPDNLKLSWYKYPLRGAYSTAPIDGAYLKKIIRHCISSLKGE